ncbi:hypothetical protein F5883DRAFT_263057 [Diaporthe sp. PMI_573]|nr:hypothetical protein F5883DRAFT_263057 [Diaporthaceae sp. PMI_573]
MEARQHGKVSRLLPCEADPSEWKQQDLSSQIDSLDFFPRTFPKLFSWRKGGPKATADTECCRQHVSETVHNPSPNHPLTYWANQVRAATTRGPFCFASSIVSSSSTSSSDPPTAASAWSG